MMKPVLHAAGLAAVLAAGVAVYHASSTAAAPPSTFPLLDGTAPTTAQLEGHVTLVNFWATSCTACLREMPQLVATYEKYRAQGYETVAVAMRTDPPAYVAQYSESRQLPFKVAMDTTGALSRDWGGVQEPPTTFLVDRHGRIVKRYSGPPDFGELHKLIEKLLADA